MKYIVLYEATSNHPKRPQKRRSWKEIDSDDESVVEKAKELASRHKKIVFIIRKDMLYPAAGTTVKVE